ATARFGADHRFFVIRSDEHDHLFAAERFAAAGAPEANVVWVKSLRFREPLLATTLRADYRHIRIVQVYEPDGQRSPVTLPTAQRPRLLHHACHRNLRSGAARRPRKCRLPPRGT